MRRLTSYSNILRPAYASLVGVMGFTAYAFCCRNYSDHVKSFLCDEMFRVGDGLYILGG